MIVKIKKNLENRSEADLQNIKPKYNIKDMWEKIWEKNQFRESNIWPTGFQEREHKRK